MGSYHSNSVQAPSRHGGSSSRLTHLIASTLLLSLRNPCLKNLPERMDIRSTLEKSFWNNGRSCRVSVKQKTALSFFPFHQSGPLNIRVGVFGVKHVSFVAEVVPNDILKIGISLAISGGLKTHEGGEKDKPKTAQLNKPDEITPFVRLGQDIHRTDKESERADTRHASEKPPVVEEAAIPKIGNRKLTFGVNSHGSISLRRPRILPHHLRTFIAPRSALKVLCFHVLLYSSKSRSPSSLAVFLMCERRKMNGGAQGSKPKRDGGAHSNSNRGISIRIAHNFFIINKPHLSNREKKAIWIHLFLPRHLPFTYTQALANLAQAASCTPNGPIL
jgi:hypothetical protein